MKFNKLVALGFFIGFFFFPALIKATLTGNFIALAHAILGVCLSLFVGYLFSSLKRGK